MHGHKCYIQIVRGNWNEVYRQFCSRTEKWRHCSERSLWEILLVGGKKLFLFLIVWHIYQSQLTVVCFDFALQISAGTVRHRSTEGVRQR